jgi:outer membrane protein OmpU
MKHTLLATTALVALTGAAAAEITISGTARIGLVTTEGAAAVAAKAVGTTYGKVDAGMKTTLDQFGKAAGTIKRLDADEFNATTTAVTFATGAQTAGDITALKLLIANGQNQLNGSLAGATADRIANDALVNTAAERAQVAADVATMQAILAAVDVSASAAAVAKKADTTVGKNRVRIAFAGSGTTDGGLTYGFSARADHSNTSTGGSQYISGAFGKISMGDLNGGDEQLVGNLSGVGSSGAGSHQEFAYQSSSHNLGYSVSMAGVSFAATTDLVRGADATKTGSNTAYGIKWSGDMGGATVGLAVGTSKIGNVTEDSMSASVSMGGLSIMAVSHTNDNGPAQALVASTAQDFTANGANWKAGTAAADNLDTDTTGLSISYAMDAMSVTAYTRTESTSGVADKDYSGVGFTYNLGGATVKAGFVDANDISIMDFGINFSF